MASNEPGKGLTVNPICNPVTHSDPVISDPVKSLFVNGATDEVTTNPPQTHTLYPSDSTRAPTNTVEDDPPTQSPTISGGLSFVGPELPEEFSTADQWEHSATIDSIKNKEDVSEGNSNRIDMGNTLAIACGAVAFLTITAVLLLMKVRGKRENNDDTGMIDDQALTMR